MTTKKHTPGPWEWGANVPDDPHTASHFRVLGNQSTSVLIHQAHWPVTDEDVRLIAAAPDLLQAAKHALSEFDDFENVCDESEVEGYSTMFDAARALRDAIAKAEGGAS